MANVLVQERVAEKPRAQPSGIHGRRSKDASMHSETVALVPPTVGSTKFQSSSVAAKSFFPAMKLNPFGPAWWSDASVTYSLNSDSFDEELSRFVAHLELTAEEKSRREQTRTLLEEAISNTWNAEKLSFGSFVTGLSMPNSDIDIAVELLDGHIPSRQELWGFAESVQKVHSGWEASVFAEAKVPLVRFFVPRLESGASSSPATDHSRRWSLQCDVTFVASVENTKKVIELQKNFLQEFPQARTMILVTKALLRMWGLNTVHSGGLSSTSIMYLVRRFLMMKLAEAKPRSDTPTSDTPAAIEPPSPKVEAAVETPADITPAVAAPNSQPTPSPAPSLTQSTGDLLLQFWLYAASPAFALEGFEVVDPNDSNNITSRGTQRMVEIQQILYGCGVGIWGSLQFVRNEELAEKQLQAKRQQSANSPSSEEPMSIKWKRHQQALKSKTLLPLGVTLLSYFLPDPQLRPPPPYKGK